MRKKYIREGGMCQFFDEHYHSFGGIDWDRINEDPLRGTKCQPSSYRPSYSSNPSNGYANEVICSIPIPKEYHATIDKIMGALSAAGKKAEEKEVPYNYNYKTF